MMQPPKPKRLATKDAQAVFNHGSVYEVNRDEVARLAQAGRTLVEAIEGQKSLIEMLGRQLADAQEAMEPGNQPRTIVLAYTPRIPLPEKCNGDNLPDTGGYWTVSEHGRHQWGLDPREATALVAAMLLGAPYPRLETIRDHEHKAAHMATFRQKAEAAFDANTERAVQAEVVTMDEQGDMRT